MAAILYARDHGPQCFEAEIILQQDSAAEFVKQLQGSGLAWYWHSVREQGRHAVPGSPELPRYRPLTLLTDQNWFELVLDIEEEVDVPNEEHRSLMLFGFDVELASPLEDSLYESAQRFFQDLGPLEVVLTRVQDLNYEYLYFPQKISPQVRRLLNAWKLDPAHPAKVRPYKKMGSATLEASFADMKRWYC